MQPQPKCVRCGSVMSSGTEDQHCDGCLANLAAAARGRYSAGNLDEWEASLLSDLKHFRSAEERSAFISMACGGDESLHERLQAKLLADRSTLDGEQGELESGGDRRLGCIGKYKLLLKLGEGGFGVVYMAEQETPVRRRVALKILKDGLQDRQVIARFEVERQALALMDHPNIARVFDAGATDQRRPYYVMELVRGEPITEYCDRNRVAPRKRLELLVDVCRAVQHAHQKGIIHRDLKPSNVLVTIEGGTPVPKVIDFGIAKAIDQRLTDKTVVTRMEQLLGTPAYMSPEQAEMSSIDVDTRTDIYSLGVLLYELLTGTTPLQREMFHQAGYDRMRQLIRELDPPRPSLRLQTMGGKVAEVARQRGERPGDLTRLLRGDLDWIVMKALEKDRTRRYETANGLAVDLQRYLNNEPVLAGPPSNWYRFQKLVRRNRGKFAAAGGVAFALLVGLGLSLYLFQQERMARRLARSEAVKSRQVAAFLQQMLRGVGPARAQGRDPGILREILDQTADRLGRDLKDQPEVEAELRLTLGQVYFDLDQLSRAEAMVREALRLRQSIADPQGKPVADALSELGRVLWRRGDLPGAEAAHRDALSIRRRLLGEGHADVIASLNNLSIVLYERGDRQGAEEIFRQVLDARRKLFGPMHPEVAAALNNLASALHGRGDLPGAEATFRQALAVDEKVHGTNHPGYASTLGSLAMVLHERGELAESEKLHREVLALHRKLVGNEHLSVAQSLNNFGNLLKDQGDLDEAESMHREALAIRRKLKGDQDLDVAISLHNLGETLRKRGELGEAEKLFRAGLEILRKVLGEDHPYVAEVLPGLGCVLRDRRDFEAAEVVLRDALARARKLWPDNAAKHAEIGRELADGLAQSGQHHEAESVLLEAEERLRRVEGMGGKDREKVVQALVRLYESWQVSAPGTGKAEQAMQWKTKAGTLSAPR